MIRQRNKTLYDSSYRIPVIVSCPDFTKDEMLAVQTAIVQCATDMCEDNSSNLTYLDEIKKLYILEHPHECHESAFVSLSKGHLKNWSSGLPIKMHSIEFPLFLNELATQFLGEKADIYWSIADFNKVLKLSTIRTFDDLKALAIELISQQNDVVLSYLYGTAEIPCSVAISSCTDRKLNESLTEYIYPVNRSVLKEKKTKGSDTPSITVDKKEMKEVVNILISGLEYGRRLQSEVRKVHMSR